MLFKGEDDSLSGVETELKGVAKWMIISSSSNKRNNNRDGGLEICSRFYDLISPFTVQF